MLAIPSPARAASETQMIHGQGDGYSIRPMNRGPRPAGPAEDHGPLARLREERISPGTASGMVGDMENRARSASVWCRDRALASVRPGPGPGLSAVIRDDDLGAGSRH